MNIKALLALGAIWISLFSAGAWLGKRVTPKWGDSEKVKSWVGNRAEFKPDSPAGVDSGTWNFRCGGDLYTYRRGSGKPEIGAVQGYYQKGPPRADPFKAEDILEISKATGLPVLALGQLIGAYRQLETKSYLAAALVGGILGFVLGFKLAHDAVPACAELREPLRDPAFWQSLVPEPGRPIGSAGVGVVPL